MTKETMLNRLTQAQMCFNRADIDGYISAIYAENVVLHFLPPDLPQGHSGAHLYYNAFLHGFPDVVLSFDDVIVKEDKMVVRYRLEGTHLGEFNGIPATDKAFSFTGITIMQWRDGKVVERWSESNFVGLLQQLGVMPY